MKLLSSFDISQGIFLVSGFPASSLKLCLFADTLISHALLSLYSLSAKETQISSSPLMLNRV